MPEGFARRALFCYNRFHNEEVRFRMNENLPTNVQLNANDNGSVIFATDVIATIAGLAATEVEGVTSMVGTASGGGLVDIFTRKNQNSKSLTRGVRIELSDNNAVSVHLTIIVDYGSPIPEVAGNIQENVKKAIETMSGLTVTSVNVHVSGVSFEREQRTAAEIEEKQRLMLQKEQEPAGDKDAAQPKPETSAEAAAAEASPEEAAPEEQPVSGEPSEEAQAEPADAAEDDDEFVLDLGDEPEDEARDEAAGEPDSPDGAEETGGAKRPDEAE